LRGVRTHNLQNIDVDIPHGGLTAVTGVSGSGKSSLAFDTLYAESQLRFLESVSPYLRQFLEKFRQPAVRSSRGLLPAMAIRSRRGARNSRSTVGTLTEIADYLRLLFVRGGTPYCPLCDGEIRTWTAPQVTAWAVAALVGQRVMIVFPWSEYSRDRRRSPDPDSLRQLGYARLVTAGRVRRLEELTELPPDASIVVDRLSVEPAQADRLQEGLRRAQEESGGSGFYLLHPSPATAAAPLPVNVHQTDGNGLCRLFFPARRLCAACGAEVPPLSEGLLSFNTPEGACPRCRGFGDIMYYDPDLYLDRTRTLRQNPVLAWSGETYGLFHRHLLRWAAECGLPTDVPLADLPPEVERGLVEGEGRFRGVAGFFRKLESKKYKMHVRVFLSRFRRFATCPDCGGSRLHPRARSVRIQGRDIGDMTTLTATELQHLVKTLHLPTPVLAALSRVIQELEKRLHCLVRLGVGYLTMERPTFTLSQGEAQRVHLAAVVGTGLADTLFILDEPTLGLHARDNARLAEILAELCTAGNTVVCVEHDPEFIRYARHIIDLGPGAGRQGGQVQYCGPMDGFLARCQSASARYLRGDPDMTARQPAAISAGGDFLEFRRATARNLRRITARFPCRAVSCITGVSGSGKSTLLEEVILAGMSARLAGAALPPTLAGITGGNELAYVRYMDQELPAGGARSTPLTWLDLFTPVRQLLARQENAVLHGITPGFFSTNVEGGRCRTCRGRGAMVLDMQFLADEEVLCEDCQGTGYSAEALQYTVQGLNIVQILQLTVSEAADVFGDLAEVMAGLALLDKVGLGYLRLGQALSTLSGGEIQRLKLCRTLLEHRSGRGRSGRGEPAPGLYLFDEPTTGLHPADTCRLLAVLEELRQAGHTVIVVEHDLYFLDHADWVVDLGPEGGEEGGLVVYQGAVSGLPEHALSHTGHALRRWRSARGEQPPDGSRPRH